MNKEQYDDLVLNYAYAMFDDMSEDEVRSYLINIFVQEKSLLTSLQLMDEIRLKYPGLIAE